MVAVDLACMVQHKYKLGGPGSRCMTTSRSSWVLEFLALWRPRVGMFLGDEEIRTLSAFLLGYEMALADAHSRAARDANVLQEFTAFLKAKFGDSNMSWEWIVEQRFQQTPELWPSEYRRSRSLTDGSTRLLYVLLDEFLLAK